MTDTVHQAYGVNSENRTHTPERNWILSPTRLPVPPYSQFKIFLAPNGGF